jgi:hypothetical protein
MIAVGDQVLEDLADAVGDRQSTAGPDSRQARL